MAFFCNVSGVRIAAPGVSKAIDPAAGQDEVIEMADSSLKAIAPGAAPKSDALPETKPEPAKHEPAKASK